MLAVSFFGDDPTPTLRAEAQAGLPVVPKARPHTRAMLFSLGLRYGRADEHLPSTARIPRRTRRRGGMAGRGVGAAPGDASRWVRQRRGQSRVCEAQI